jgi:hypothetical protein
MPLVLNRMRRHDDEVVDDYQFSEGRIPVGRLYLSKDRNEPGWHWSIYPWVIRDAVAPKGIAETQEAAVHAFSTAWGRCTMRDYRPRRRPRGINNPT